MDSNMTEYVLVVSRVRLTYGGRDRLVVDGAESLCATGHAVTLVLRASLFSLSSCSRAKEMVALSAVRRRGGQPPSRAGQGQPARCGCPQGQQPVGAVPTGTAGCEQPIRVVTASSTAPAKGQAAGLCAKVAAAGGHPGRGWRPRPGRKGRLPTVRLQRGRPPATSLQGAIARGQPYRLRRGNGDCGTVRVKEG
ncbi:hypothetical protein BHE74_00024293 [Ensete ventricosum]|nr:hypothetical protein BHE74_00024293 [Ensete ventricosum]